jgi:PadR family transcriptional regulator, regulatory protein PadR
MYITAMHHYGWPHYQCTTSTIMEFNKDLIAASSTPIVLAILSEGDSYGYAIIKRVQEASGGHMEWTDGMLYPVLHRLERLGFIKARWELAESGRRRKYYRITSRGKDQLREESRQWEAVDATLRGIWKMVSLPLPISFSHPDSTAPACRCVYEGGSLLQGA